MNKINDKKFLEKLGQRVAKKRKSAGFSQQSLADHLKKSRTAITRIEQGGTNPTILTLNEIAKALGCEVNEFLVDTKD